MQIQGRPEISSIIERSSAVVGSWSIRILSRRPVTKHSRQQGPIRVIAGECDAGARNLQFRPSQQCGQVCHVLPGKLLNADEVEMRCGARSHMLCHLVVKGFDLDKGLEIDVVSASKPLQLSGSSQIEVQRNQTEKRVPQPGDPSGLRQRRLGLAYRKVAVYRPKRRRDTLHLEILPCAFHNVVMVQRIGIHLLQYPVEGGPGRPGSMPANDVDHLALFCMTPATIAYPPSTSGVPNRTY